MNVSRQTSAKRLSADPTDHSVKRPVRVRYLPVPSQDAPDAGRVILRDGTAASIRLAQPADKKMMRAFFESLSKVSSLRRFQSLAQPSDKLISFFCDPSNPKAQLTLIVTRSLQEHDAIIAVGTYAAGDGASAEVAFAVSDAFQGRGVGTLLLERLALLAIRHGITRFWATTTAENRRMLDVFRDSGFTCRTRSEGESVEIDFSVVPTEASVAQAEMRDRISTVASLRPYFHPRSVAVVGASRNPANIGRRVLDALTRSGFKGTVYAVNPKASFIDSIRAFPSVRELPEIPDLVVIAVPRDAVLNVVDDCASRGARTLIVITAGFAESGVKGRELQQRLVEKARGHGMRIIGPNCFGIINTDRTVCLNASFAPVFPAPGRIGFSSQSGALGLAVLSLAQRRGVGISEFVSVGNKADVSGNDLLQYWEEDPQTRVILLYLESFGNPRRFARIARRVGRRKPIVAIKSGRSGAGTRAAGSHTAALAVDDSAVEALFHQTGVIRADTLNEMFDLAAALSDQPLPRGRRVAILTNAGGLGILCADTCEASGLRVQTLSEPTKNRLRAFLPESASVANPVDMIASAGPSEFQKATEILLEADEVDALIILYIDVALAGVENLTQGIGAGISAGRSAGGQGKPVLACVMAGTADPIPIRAGAESIPNYAFPENAARVLGKIAAYSDWRNQADALIPDFEDVDLKTARELCQSAVGPTASSWLSSDQTRKVLEAVRLPATPSIFSATADDAARAATTIGFPVAVKLASREIVHKSDVGGVRLNLMDEASVRQAYTAIRQTLIEQNKLSAMDGVIVQPMLEGGVELMVGVTEDPSFGPLVAFGLGGIHVEVLRDIGFRITPLTERDAAEMIRSIRGYPLLEGYRGHPAADISALEDLLLRVSRLVEEVPEISEIDLNPVVALPPGQGCRILDARIKVHRL